jgi:hypothetical protein
MLLLSHEFLFYFLRFLLLDLMDEFELLLLLPVCLRLSLSLIELRLFP